MNDNFFINMQNEVIESINEIDSVIGKAQRFLDKDHNVAIILNHALQKDKKFNISVFVTIKEQIGLYLGYFENKLDLNELIVKLIRDLKNNLIYSENSEIGIEKRLLELN